jgi:hypothetical protein
VRTQSELGEVEARRGGEIYVNSNRYSVVCCSCIIELHVVEGIRQYLGSLTYLELYPASDIPYSCMILWTSGRALNKHSVTTILFPKFTFPACSPQANSKHAAIGETKIEEPVSLISPLNRKPLVILLFMKIEKPETMVSETETPDPVVGVRIYKIEKAMKVMTVQLMKILLRFT